MKPQGRQVGVKKFEIVHTIPIPNSHIFRNSGLGIVWGTIIGGSPKIPPEIERMDYQE